MTFIPVTRTDQEQNMLDPKLETLLTVYEEKSYTKAAARLQLTQPAVSTQMGLLEKQLGCQLCVRAKGQLVFTAEGELVINYARRMKAAHTKMLKDIAEKQHTPSTLKIGVTRAIESDSIISGTLGQYISTNTNSNITIISDAIEKLYDMLENFEVDIIIIDAPPTNPLFSYHLLEITEVLCVTGRNHPLAARGSVTLDELKQERMIIRPPSSATRALFEAALKKVGESIDHMNIVLEVDSFTTIKLLIRNHVGVSIMRQCSCQHDLNKKNFCGLHIEELDLKQEIHLAYRKDFPYPKVPKDLARIYHESNYD